MRLFKLLLFFIIPSLILHPLQAYERPSCHEIISLFQKETALIKRITVNGIPHFDLIISLLEDIENDNIDEDIDIQEINEFLVFMVRLGFHGTPEEWEALERANRELLEGTCGDDEYDENDLSFIYNYSGEIVLCGGLGKSVKKAAKAVKKAGKSVKKGAKNSIDYLKEHKKETIIVAVAAVGVAALGIVVTSALGTAAAVAASDSSSKEDNKKHNSNSSKTEALTDSPHVFAGIQDPHTNEIFQECIENLREELYAEASNDLDPSILDNARELGSYITHQILDGASEIISQIPDAIDTVKGLGSQLFQNDEISREQNHSKENFENLIAKGHQIIDDAFSTNQAKYFDLEEQETDLENDFDIGTLPPPTSAFYGKKGWELKNPKYQPTKNATTQIEGRIYRGHALDQMQNRGIPPSVVENTIRNGKIVNVNQNTGTVEYYDHVNKIKVVLNENEEVVTAIRIDKVN